MERKSEGMREMLREPISPSGLKQNPGNKSMTVINPMFVIERLNDVFGIMGWNYTILDSGNRSYKVTQGKGKEWEKEVDNYSAWVRIRFSIGDWSIENFGGSDNSDLGDALKGAVTDAITKCSSFLEIGHHVFKGQTTPDGAIKPEFLSNNQPANQQQAIRLGALFSEGIIIPPNKEDAYNKAKDAVFSGNQIKSEWATAWIVFLERLKSDQDAIQAKPLSDGAK